MRIRLAELGRRVARWIAGLLLVPMGLLSFVLFCATGRPIPREFIPADQMDFSLARSVGVRDLKGQPFFLGFSANGRCFITSTLHAVEPGHAPLHPTSLMSVNLLDTQTMQSLGSFRARALSLTQFETSADRKSVITATDRGLRVRHLDSGKEDFSEIKTHWKDEDTHPNGTADTVFAPDGRHVLIRSEARAICFDMVERQVLAEFRGAARSDNPSLFFRPTRTSQRTSPYSEFRPFRSMGPFFEPSGRNT